MHSIETKENCRSDTPPKFSNRSFVSYLAQQYYSVPNVGV